MSSRRKFIFNSLLASTALMGISKATGKINKSLNKLIKPNSEKPVVISTWQFGAKANEIAYNVLRNNGKAIDAVEQGVKYPEGDPDITSVGYGGIPDWDGNVTLDSSIMDENNNAGSVAYLQHIKHPVSVARKVMDLTPHVMLVGEGALQFALNNGFKKENLLTDKAKEEWRKLRKEIRDKQDYLDKHNHDTIGMLAFDNFDNLSGACTTSGLKMKLPGRVGDSPIIGAGLFVDNEIGAATATGTGELVIRIAGSHTVVELMRQGYSPEEACKEAVKRILAKIKDYKNEQVAFIAINKSGEVGAFAILPGFEYAVYKNGENKLIKANAIKN